MEHDNGKLSLARVGIMADYTTASAMTQQELLVKRLLASQHIIISATVQRFMPGPPQRVTVSRTDSSPMPYRTAPVLRERKRPS